MLKKKTYLLISLAILFAASPVMAAGTTDGPNIALTFLWIALILFIAKISSFVDRFGQPPVLGELIVGIMLGNLALIGFSGLEAMKSSEILTFLAEIGVVILLFQIGLESNIGDLRRVGVRAIMVALVGVIVPFVLGTFLIGPWFFAAENFSTHLFLGATLTATSVGITARVFKDLGKLNTKEAKIVLGASVIDDVLGLIMLAVVTGIVVTGSIDTASVVWIIFKAFGFLALAILFGQIMSRQLTKFMLKIQTDVSSEFAIALSMGLFFAYLADVVGLAPIIGAFAAGLILDEVKIKIPEEVQKDSKTRKSIEEVIEPLGFFFVPIFFVVTGMSVNLDVFSSSSVVATALIITVIAIAGKIVAGLVAGKTNKMIVGLGMVPRGEVGLIFAAVGQGLGVISQEIFSIIVVMVIITTIITPVGISVLYNKKPQKNAV